MKSRRKGKKEISRRRVMIATPVKSIENGISPYFADALTPTIKSAANLGIEIFPVYDLNTPLQFARNVLLAIAVQSPLISDMFWIDSDVGWNPDHFFRLLNYPVDVVGGTYRKKKDPEEYPVQVLSDKVSIDEKTRLLEVDGLGLGFLRISRKAMLALWDSHEEKYTSNGLECRNVFQFPIINGEVISEDIFMCHKFKDLGFKTYLDPSISCLHAGTKAYQGDFLKFLEKIVVPQTPN